MPDMRIAFAGSGNIATHLAIAFKRAGFEINCIYSRNKVHAVKLASKVKCAYTTTPADLKADLIVIAVNDDAINLVSDQIVSGKSIVVHTSGSVGLDVLSTHKNRGVFYPLQTFSPGRRVDFNSIPLCIEASSTPVKGKLFSVARAISSRVYGLSSAQRQVLHLSAVIANNFTNRLFVLSEQLLMENNLSFDLLRPLILETAKKVQSNSPAYTQTGPAKRGDKKIIKKHVEILCDHPELQRIYKMLSASILSGD